MNLTNRITGICIIKIDTIVLVVIFEYFDKIKQFCILQKVFFKRNAIFQQNLSCFYSTNSISKS